MSSYPIPMQRRRVDENGYPIPDNAIDLVPELNRRTGQVQNVYQNQYPSPQGQQPAMEPDYPDYGLSDIYTRPVVNPDSLDYQRSQSALYPLAMDEARRRAAKAEREKAAMEPPIPVKEGEMLVNRQGQTLARNPKAEPTMTPYQNRTLDLRERTLAAQQQKTETPKPTTPTEARQIFAQMAAEANRRLVSGEMPEGTQPEDVMRQVAEEQGIDYDELLRLRAGQAQAQPAAALPNRSASGVITPETAAARKVLAKPFGAGAATQVRIQKNKLTGEYRHSVDGGKTWLPGQP